jgi:hypothetical protein
MTYLFFRDDMFYPLNLSGDEEAIENAKCNPGTVRVEDVAGRVVWSSKTQ